MAHVDVADVQAKMDFYSQNGFVQVDQLITAEEVALLGKIYDSLLDGTVDVSKHRYDLGSGEERKLKDRENVTQIMWPSDMVEELQQHPMRQRALKLVADLYGDPVELWDFDFGA